MALRERERERERESFLSQGASHLLRSVGVSEAWVVEDTNFVVSLSSLLESICAIRKSLQTYRNGCDSRFCRLLLHLDFLYLSFIIAGAELSTAGPTLSKAKHKG